jgi:hypothetical protein
MITFPSNRFMVCPDYSFRMAVLVMFSHALDGLKSMALRVENPRQLSWTRFEAGRSSLSDHEMKGHPTLIAPAELD